MKEIAFEILVIVMLIMVNGFLAMAEIAVVSAKKAILRRKAEQGNLKAKAALEMAESPTRFLSTVQIGITLVGILAGAYGGATLAEKLADFLSMTPVIGRFAEAMAVAIVVTVITYLSLVFGELVPKRIGLSYPEKIAALAARPMLWLSEMAGPVVRFLSISTDAVLKVMNLRSAKKDIVTEDEIKGLMQEGVRAGAFAKAEGQMVSNVLDLDQMTVRDIMTPRPKITWLNQDDNHQQIWHKIVISKFSSFPVYEKNHDRVAGVVSVKAIYANLAAGVEINLKDLMVKPMIVPESQDVPRLLESLKNGQSNIALVADEFGNITGMVTPHDVVEAIIGDLPSLEQRLNPEIKLRNDGTWLIDGMVDIERVERVLPGFREGGEGNRDYQTMAGYLVKRMGHLPSEGETLDSMGYIFEVLDMDGPRIDKVIVVPTSTVKQVTKGL
ncbi:MAG: hemolysin family protein [Kiritimatiellae bacterium]|nr:hemolysin family protein [Kiritimatiellia bacterium]